MIYIIEGIMFFLANEKILQKLLMLFMLKIDSTHIFEYILRQ